MNNSFKVIPEIGKHESFEKCPDEFLKKQQKGYKKDTFKSL